MEKEKFINLIQELNDEKMIHYLYVLCKDYVKRHNSKEIIEQCEVNNLLIRNIN